MSDEQRQRYGSRIRYWCQDECRVGLLTVQHRKLTALGVKPVGEVQWQFLYRWLYGVIEPATGKTFMLEFSHLDSLCFETFLTALAQAYPNDLHLIQLDNAPAHRAHALQVPDNIILLFQPPYCPEVNPIERLWQELKRVLAWRHFDSLHELQQAISQWLARLSPAQVRSLTQWGWLIDALCVAGI
ncbi:IS630 family transposase [Nodosilinea sp. FACHB-13]|uniref:IS630 family transposase n=1 Tax=Cyanophyceae TaxID=3028117 RepID=UPI0018F015CB|nr:IS630 family transposase [Nodosilinea sp. FACHB-13]